MFKFFNSRTAEDYKKAAEGTYKMSKPNTPKINEMYRVGITANGMTTLTLMGDNGYSMTMTMDRESCETMIRMLRATYTEQQPTEEE